jgi:hypothetical protein
MENFLKQAAQALASALHELIHPGFGQERDRLVRVEAMLSRIDRRHERLSERLKDLEGGVQAILRQSVLDPEELPFPYRLTARRFRITSQNQEDGILFSLFERIGATDRRFVEIGCGSNGGNSGFLAQDCGWSGLMVDSSDSSIQKILIRYSGRDVVAQAASVTPENVNALLADHGLVGEIDLLSIDIDSSDYWVWQAIEVCSPRVVVIEYNPHFGRERAVTVPAIPGHDRKAVERSYYGASLPALVQLGRTKGYRLVATERINAFFIRNDVAPEIPACEPERVWRAPVESPAALLERLEARGLPLIEVAPSAVPVSAAAGALAGSS